MVVGGVSIHNMHVVNTVRPLHPEVYDEEIPLQLFFVLLRVTFEIVLPSTYGATCVDFGVVTHMHGGEGLEIVVTHCGEASLLAVEGVADVKCYTTSIAMFRSVRGLDVVYQEEGIPPFLSP